MAKRPKPMLDGPIPGQSLTSEPGARPWENPARYATVEDTLSFYIENLSQPKKMASMLDKIEEGAPLTLIADTLQTVGVSKGIHSLDVGVLISPVLIEFMKAAAEQEDISYTIGTEEDEDQVGADLAHAAVKEVYAKEDEPVSEEPELEDMPVNKEELAKKSGLMARKTEEPVDDGV